MPYWSRRNFISLGMVTSGHDPDQDRIDHLAMSVFYGSRKVWEFSWIVKEDAERFGIMRHAVSLVNRLREFKLPLVVFNAPMELSFFRAECRRTGTSLDTRRLYVIDPLIIDYHYRKQTRPVNAFKRECELATRYGLLPPMCDALADATAVGYIAIAQSLHHSAIASASVMQLHRSQMIWYKEWNKKYHIDAPSWPFGI